MKKAILKVDGLNKCYGGIRALNNVSFEIHPGEIVGLLGHNGAGKSTLIKCLMGAIQSYSGSIFMSGKDIRRSHKAIRKNAGFLLEPSFCDYMSARANLEMIYSVSDKQTKGRVDKVLELVSLKKFADKKVGEFSFGMRQRLGLAQVLLSRPRIIVLDEPTVGLDPLGIEIIKNIIVKCSEVGIAVLFSSHQLGDVMDICHRAIVMNEGNVVYDGDAATLNRKYYSIETECDITEHSNMLTEIIPEAEISSNLIRFSHKERIGDMLKYLVEHNIPIVDMDTDIGMDYLKSLMKQ